MKKQFYFTKQGAQKLASRIEALNNRIKEIQAEKSVAYWGSGDGWHDNPGFNQLEQLEFRTVNEMTSLRNQLEGGVIWDSTKNNPHRVQIGHRVSILQVNVSNGKRNQLTISIVGHQESVLAKLWISYDSPIGSALLQKKVGQTVKYLIPAGEFEATILSIEENPELI
jgi:transcription elongation factor GreA